MIHIFVKGHLRKKKQKKRKEGEPNGMSMKTLVPFKGVQKSIDEEEPTCKFKED
jgi:hypothetical protein